MAYNIPQIDIGQAGGTYLDDTGVYVAPTGKVIVAITMLADTVFNATNGLVADNDGAAGLEYVGTDVAAHDAALSPDLGESGVGGQVADTITFPKGVTIYGRWTKVINNAATPIMLYIGN